MKVAMKDFTYVALLKDCTKKKDISEGIRLHADILKTNLLESSPYLASALINMYAKCGMIVKAHQYLEELLVRDVISWNALISGYTHEGKGHEALNCFEQMQCEGLSPDVVTFTNILSIDIVSALCVEATIDESDFLIDAILSEENG